MGLNGIQPEALARLLEPSDMESAVIIMANTRAYFQGRCCSSLPGVPRLCTASHRVCTVAYKRFVDNVPMAIDRTLVWGVLNGLENAILNGLGMNGPEGFENCRRLLQEPSNIVERRKELKMRKERLNNAQQELLNVFA